LLILLASVPQFKPQNYAGFLKKLNVCLECHWIECHSIYL